MSVADTALASALRDRYALEREIGRGGMAAVYLARDLKHGRPVAIKVPSEVSRARLRADPVWAPRRGHPRFEALVAEP